MNEDEDFNLGRLIHNVEDLLRNHTQQKTYKVSPAKNLGRVVTGTLLDMFCNNNKLPTTRLDEVVRPLTSIRTQSSIESDYINVLKTTEYLEGEIFDSNESETSNNDKEFDVTSDTLLYKIVYRNTDLYCLVYQWHYRADEEDSSFLIGYPEGKEDIVKSFCSEFATFIKAFTQNTDYVLVMPGGYFITRPDVSLDSVILPKVLKNDILLNIENFFSSKAIYQKLGIPCKRGFLFVGPPGNGKTSLCKAIASEFDIPFCYISVGRAEQRNFNWKSIFARVKELTPCIVLIEDLDRILENNQDETQTFLNALDGFESLDNVLIMATSNDASKIDPALINRPSRFDRVWKFNLPDRDIREEFLTKFSKGYFSKETIKKVADQTDQEFSFALLREVVTQALLIAANQDRDPKDEDIFKSVELLKRQLKSAKTGFVDDEKDFGFKTSKNVDVGIQVGDPVIKLPRRKKK